MIRCCRFIGNLGTAPNIGVDNHFPRFLGDRYPQFRTVICSLGRFLGLDRHYRLGLYINLQFSLAQLSCLIGCALIFIHNENTFREWFTVQIYLFNSPLPPPLTQFCTIKHDTVRLTNDTGRRYYILQEAYSNKATGVKKGERRSEIETEGRD